MKLITFIKGHRMYQPGEKAGFADTEADALIAAGLAYDPIARAKAEAAAEADAKAAAQAEADAKAAAERAEADAKADKPHTRGKGA